MKRYIITILVAISAILAVPIHGETVSQKQAQQLAQQFFNEAAGRIVAPCKLVYNGRKLTTARLFIPFYIYNQPAGGFVIISAENKAFPILGFSLKDNFNPDRLGDTELELLKSYAREIELIRYDSGVPYEAIEAWNNYPQYVSEILRAPYDATDPNINIEEADNVLATSLEFDQAVFSDIYTPQQWRDMILDELRLKQSVPMWLIGNLAVYPMVVYGHQGDYFRIEMSKRNSWLMRLNATENVSSNMVSVINYPIELDEAYEELKPFVEYDTFAEEVEAIERKRSSKIGVDITVIDDKPIVKANGSGYFQITIPEEAIMARVYNLGGAMINMRTFADTNVVFLDLSAEPQGFYFVNVIGTSGNSYGVKIYR